MPAPAILLSGRLKAAVYSVADVPIIVVPEVPTFSIGSSFTSVTTSPSGAVTATFSIGRAGGLLLGGSVGYKVTGLDGSWFQGGAAPDTTVDFGVGDTSKAVSITFAAKDLPDSALTGTVTLYVSLLGGLLGGTYSFTFTIPKKAVTPGARDFSLGTNSNWLFESFDARLGLYLERTFPGLTDYGSEVSTTAELQTALNNAAENTRIRVASGTTFGTVTFSRKLGAGKWIMIDGQPDLARKQLNARCSGTINCKNSNDDAAGLVIRGIDFSATTGTASSPGASRVILRGDRMVMQRCRIEGSKYIEWLVGLTGPRSDVVIELNTFKNFNDHAVHTDSMDAATKRDQGVVIAWNLMEDAKGGWQPNTPGNDPTVCIYLGDNLGQNNPYRQTKAVCYNWFESVGEDGNARGILECKHPRLAFFGNVYKVGTGTVVSCNARGCFGHLFLCNDLEGDISIRGRRSAVLWNRLRAVRSSVTLQYGNYDQENDSYLNDVGNGSFPGTASPRPVGASARLFGNVCDGPILFGGDVHNDIPGSGNFTEKRPCRDAWVQGHTVSSGPMYKTVTGEGASPGYAQTYSNGNIDTGFNAASSHTLNPTVTTVPAGLRKPDIPTITKAMVGCFGDQSSLSS